jgi:hypothetical protein
MTVVYVYSSVESAHVLYSCDAGSFAARKLIDNVSNLMLQDNIEVIWINIHDKHKNPYKVKIDPLTHKSLYGVYGVPFDWLKKHLPEQADELELLVMENNL